MEHSSLFSAVKPYNVIYNPLHPDAGRLERVITHLLLRTGYSRKAWENLFDIYPCIHRTDVVQSINASHKMIVRLAKEAGLPEVCILEDDVFFPAEDGWDYWLSHKPNRFDLYLAGTYGQRWEENSLSFVTVPVGFHGYFVQSQFYDKFLAVDSGGHIDTAMEGLGNFRVCYPYAAVQRAGWSANHRKEVDYNRALGKGDIYHGHDPDFYTTPD